MKCVCLLDEYDTPMQEAWLSGYRDKAIIFFSNFFNATFKTNPYLNQGMITGITRIDNENIFIGMNNLKIVITIRGLNYSQNKYFANNFLCIPFYGILKGYIKGISMNNSLEPFDMLFFLGLALILLSLTFSMLLTGLTYLGKCWHGRTTFNF